MSLILHYARVVVVLYSVMLFGFKAHGEVYSVQVSLVDSFGKPLPVHAEVKLTDQTGRSLKVTAQRNMYVADVSPGTYTLTVRSDGFENVTRKIVVVNASVALQIGLMLSEIGDSTRTGTTLRGRILRCPAATRTWVRLSGLYVENVYQTLVASDCSFVFSGVAFGDFLAYVISDGKVLYAKAVRVVLDSDELIIDVDAGSAQSPE